MKSIYAKRGITYVGEHRRPETILEKFARRVRNKLRRLRAPAELEPEQSLRDQTRPGNPSGGLRGETRPDGDLRDETRPY